MATTDDIAEIVRTLDDGTDEEQREAFQVLRRISKPQPEILVPHLDTICSFASHENMEIRRNVAIILSKVAGHNPTAVTPHADVVSTLLLNDDPLVLAFATLVAMRITSESPAALADATDRLIELLTYGSDKRIDEVDDIRSRTILTLGILAKTDPALAARLNEPLAERLDNPNTIIRSGTVTTLHRLGLAHPEAVSTALARLPSRLDDPDPKIRYSAMLAIVDFRHDQPNAISDPNTVATALRQAADQTELTDDETKVVRETCQYLEKNRRGFVTYDTTCRRGPHL